MIDQTENISYFNELLRKSIHLCSLSIPIFYIFVSKFTLISFLIPMTIITLIIDIYGRNGKFLHGFVSKYFIGMLRPHELKGGVILNGASWVLLSSICCSLFFPKILFVVSFTILIISDLCAALFGRRFGRHRLFDKSLEGTLAFIISGFAVIAIYWQCFHAPISFLLLGFLGTIIGGLTEAASGTMKMDDNFSIPISVSLVMWIGNFFITDLSQQYINLLR